MILGKNLAPAEKEQTVKTYHCTSFKSRLLGISAEGYLEVTNKRVIFQASGGNSLIHSEVPIEEISGISLFRGSYFSIFRFLGSLVLTIFLGGILTMIFFIDRYGGEMTVLSGILALVGGVASFAVPKNLIWKSMFAGISASGVASFLAGILGFGLMTYLPIALIVGVYPLVCAVWYATRQTMSLAVNAKGGSNTPIAISGASNGGVLYSSAARALEAEPASDAEAVMKELGALIMDIQQLGDYGIEKWSTAQTD